MPESALAQTSRTLKVSVSAGGGVIIPQADLRSGSLISLAFRSAPPGYALSRPGYHLGGKIKLDFPALPMTLVGLASYSALSRDTTITVQSPISPPSEVAITLSGHIITVGAGLEYGLLAGSHIKPYVGADASLSILKGSVENFPYGIYSTIEVQSTLRFGTGIGLGCQIDFPSWPFAVEVDAKYRLANWLGKAYDTPALVGGNTRRLNDGKNPGNPDDRARSINFFSIYVGFVFTFG